MCELNVFTEKKPSNMECIGTSYKLQDFQIKFGVVTHSSSNRGLIAEVSYLCGNTHNDSYGLLNEYASSIFGWYGFLALI